MKFNYSDFINLVTTLELQIIMNETDNVYYLTAYNGPVLIRCDLPKTIPANANQILFETNFKATANRKIRSEVDGAIQLTGGDKLYKVAVDSVGRVATNANVTFPETIYQSVDVANGSNTNANVNATLGSPQNFRWSAPAGQTWYIENLTILINDNANFPNNGFGALASLTNGIQINVRSKGQDFTIGTFRNNYDVIKSFPKETFSSVAAGLLSTDRLFRGTMQFQNRIVLDGSLGDYIELRARDNLTGLTGLFLNALVWRLLG